MAKVEPTGRRYPVAQSAAERIEPVEDVTVRVLKRPDRKLAACDLPQAAAFRAASAAP